MKSLAMSIQKKKWLLAYAWVLQHVAEVSGGCKWINTYPCPVVHTADLIKAFMMVTEVQHEVTVDTMIDHQAYLMSSADKKKLDLGNYRTKVRRNMLSRKKKAPAAA